MLVAKVMTWKIIANGNITQRQLTQWDDDDDGDGYYNYLHNDYIIIIV